jgi:hypothetical protein
VEVNNPLSISSVTSTARYKEREVRRGENDTVIIASLRADFERFVFPAIVNDPTVYNRLTRVIGRGNVHPNGRWDKSRSVHNNGSEAILYPIH